MHLVPNHPYALYRVGVYRPSGQMVIELACRRCGDRTQHRCSRHHLRDQRILQYAMLHAHGLVARRVGA